jgi:UDP-3-O-[3-hydroxymyristoyl] glucosamine N-acyltransferase
MKFSARQVTQWTDGQCIGPDNTVFSGIEVVDRVQTGFLTLIGAAKFAKNFASSPAAGALCNADVEVRPRPDQVIIRVPNADLAMIKVLENLQLPSDTPKVGVHPTTTVAATAVIDPSARIGPQCVIGENAVIGCRTVLEAQVFVGDGCVIGNDCRLHAQCVIRAQSELGHRVILHSGCVIGADGFGYVFSEGRHHKIPHIGQVRIEDDCELGANTCVDRGKYTQTVIGAGSKLDNLVQVGHNVVLGRHTILVSQVGVAGSVTAGDYLVMGGGSVLADHITVGAGTQVAGFSAVVDDTPSGARMLGAPARPARQFFAELKALSRLTKSLQDLKELQERVAKIESTTKDHRA